MVAIMWVFLIKKKRGCEKNSINSDAILLSGAGVVAVGDAMQ